MSSKERGIGGVVAEAAGEQVELVDKGRGSIEKVDDSEIPSGIRHPALPTVEAVAKVKIDRRPRIDATCRHGARIPISAGVVHGRKDCPAPERPREMRCEAQLQGVADRVGEVESRRSGRDLLFQIGRASCRERV